MRFRTGCLVALTAAAFLSLSTAGASNQAAGTRSIFGDGLLRSELSLGGYTTTVASLSSGGAATPPASGASRVRVAELETNSSLQIGPLAVGKVDPAGVRYDLWLDGKDGQWQLELAQRSNGAGAEGSTVVGRMPLNTAARPGPAASGFVAALVPETGSTARLVLRWAEHEARTDVRFTAPPKPRRVADGSTAPNVTTNRRHDEDTSALSRARLLAQREETALTTPSGHRLSVSFQRTLGKNERSASNDGGVRTRGLPADGPDFARLASTADGAVVILAEAAVPRLRIERPLRFGRAGLATGNQVPGFPGSYGLWLKRAGRGWKLVFNHEPDAWGSQHNPKFDAAEIDLTHSESGDPSRPFAVGLAPTAADRGRLIILWGPHDWSADFEVVN